MTDPDDSLIRHAADHSTRRSSHPWWIGALLVALAAHHLDVPWADVQTVLDHAIEVALAIGALVAAGRGLYDDRRYRDGRGR